MNDCFTKLLFLLVPLFCVNEVIGYKYLGIFPFQAKSHYFLGNELMKGLARAGHEATILTSHEEKNPPNDNYKQIILEGFLEQQKVLLDKLKHLHTNSSIFTNPAKGFFTFMETLDLITEMTLNHSTTQKMIKEKPKYDVVIITHFNFEALKALAPHFGAHQVVFFNLGASNWINHLVGTPSLPSIDPTLMLQYTGQMDFKQRLFNTIFCTVQYLYNNFVIYPRHKELVHKYISEDLDLDKILYNVSLALYNSHVSLDRPTAEVPCTKNIGGFHIRPPKKLPEDLRKYLDDAKDGVIYFSMGSTVQSADFPPKTKEAILKAFSKRKEKVLWKFEEDLPGKPPNVKIDKWLPQMDILAHPNIKLFITQGGLLSLIETLYNGVPTISIPVLGDQLKNAKVAESNGYSKVIQLGTLTEEDFSAAIEEVISNDKYRKNAQAQSKLFFDRPVKPMEEAVYWLEYVVRHNGALHLRMKHLDLAWYQYYMLDIIGAIIFIIFLIIFIFIKLLSCILGTCIKPKNKSKKVKKQ
ncbi:UDP-glycosyltransferase UGT5-like [Diorhabda carinulata]|uniref:UDP-glycosyltransferase UGT5-like n=1 Tax=Diorhabda carinulata TaxID=1163345 RepID=UPI0025A211C8|nr:UDP-glycosyltransferase UGT5-like [Diorhabda carinulata]